MGLLPISVTSLQLIPPSKILSRCSNPRQSFLLDSGSLSIVAAVLMKIIVICFADADAAVYYVATADFIGTSCRTRRSDAASDAAFYINKTNKN
ncbi:unnamed protein product [Brassica rapa subsp. trilocularis]